jgi:hypothetical protein
VSEDREMNQPRQSEEEADVEAHGTHPGTQPASAEPAATEEGPDVEAHGHYPGTHPAPEAAATEEGPDVEGHIHTPANVQPNVEP